MGFGLNVLEFKDRFQNSRPIPGLWAVLEFSRMLGKPWLYSGILGALLRTQEACWNPGMIPHHLPHGLVACDLLVCMAIGRQLLWQQ